jgi:predicted nucleic acid-binding protein
LIALLTNEEGAEIVKDLLQKALEGKTKIIMHKINLLEVYYDTYKTYNKERALKLLKDMESSPIRINSEITDEILMRAGKLKATYKVSLADSIGLAETIINEGYFVTADHHELEIVEQKEKIKIVWIREKSKDPPAAHI